MRKFRSEAQAAAGLLNPNIVNYTHLVCKRLCHNDSYVISSTVAVCFFYQHQYCFHNISGAFYDIEHILILHFVRKFLSEAQAAAGLLNPNIVNVYDVGEDRGLNYMVMELVEGITLKDYIEKKGRLSHKEVISIAIQMIPIE